MAIRRSHLHAILTATFLEGDGHMHDKRSLMAVSTGSHHQRRWTREEFHKLYELGLFAADEPLELVDGEIIVMAAQLAPHRVGVGLLQRALQTAYGPQYWVCIQSSLPLDVWSEPEPDIAVLPGHPLDYLDEHQPQPLLICEVSASTLRLDRVQKQRIYARACVPEYWILNLKDMCLEVYRQPRKSVYERREVHGSADRVGLPGLQTSIQVRDILPLR